MGMKLEFIDMRRAYFHAKARTMVYVSLPEEDMDEGMYGRLGKAMYGTRDAAQHWEHEYVEFMEGIGFKQGMFTTCVFWNEERAVMAVVHGDDFTLLVGSISWQTWP